MFDRRDTTRKLRDSVKVSFPWVAYISQPIGHPTVTLIINPIKFQKLYTIWMLENCLRQKSTIRGSKR
jgi:hypothetical protein